MRQYILDKTPDKNGLVVIIGKDYRYLRQVLRIKVGDMLNVRLPDGSLKNTTVAQIDENAKRVTLQLCSDTGKTITRGVQADTIESCSKEDGIEFWLFQFLPKPQKFEQIVRQATECGVLKIIPVIGEYSEKSSISALSDSKAERLERIVKEARQQSGSPVNTAVEKPTPLPTAISLWKAAAEGQTGASLGFVLSERDEGIGTIREIIQNTKDLKRICIAVGSEGGISPSELEALVEEGAFHPIHFSGNILRCETAALYGIAAVQTAV